MSIRRDRRDDVSNKVISLISFLILITPPIVMTSGFSMSILGSLLLLVLLKEILTSVSWNKIISLKFIINNYKLEFILASWCIFSLIGTVSNSELILSSIKIFAFIYFFLIIKVHLPFIREKISDIEEYIKYGIILATMIFLIEYLSHGIIIENIRLHIIKNPNFCFHLCYLDRGCAFLSVCYWILCKLLVNKKQYATAIIFYSIILFILCISDCLAGLVAFISGGLIFLSIFLNKNFAKIITYLLLLGSLAFPIISWQSNPQYISDSFNKLPLSAKERIFIWNFVANKVQEHPIKGIGINNSRYINIPENERINYNGHIFSQFQLHPHNNILQILLELGTIGFIISLMLVYKYTNRITDPSTYASFINYYVIGMISYSIWQSWWMISGVWIYSLMQLCLRK